MVTKCTRCGEPVVKFPLKNPEGKFIWKNLFMMSWDSIVLIVIIIAMVTAYNIDVATCKKITENPVAYCSNSNACKVLEEQLIYKDAAGTPLFKKPQ